MIDLPFWLWVTVIVTGWLGVILALAGMEYRGQASRGSS